MEQNLDEIIMKTISELIIQNLKNEVKIQAIENLIQTQVFLTPFRLFFVFHF